MSKTRARAANGTEDSRPPQDRRDCSQLHRGPAAPSTTSPLTSNLRAQQMFALLPPLSLLACLQLERGLSSLQAAFMPL